MLICQDIRRLKRRSQRPIACVFEGTISMGRLLFDATTKRQEQTRNLATIWTLGPSAYKKRREDRVPSLVRKTFGIP